MIGLGKGHRGLTRKQQGGFIVGEAHDRLARWNMGEWGVGCGTCDEERGSEREGRGKGWRNVNGGEEWRRG